MEFSLKPPSSLTTQSLWTIAVGLPRRLKKLDLDFSCSELAIELNTTNSDGRGEDAKDAHKALTHATEHIADCVLDFDPYGPYGPEDDYSDYESHYFDELSGEEN